MIKAMEFEIAGFIFVSFLWGVWVWRRRRFAAEEQLPPGPPRWPVVGNLLQLSFSAHESFTKLAAKYGPIMTLHLGSMSTVVVSSSTAAREMFKNHDAPLAGRMIYDSMRGNHGTEGSLIASQYGPHWRMLRRLATTEFFVTRRLDAMRHVRRRCVDNMVRFVEEETAVRRDSVCGNMQAIDLGKFFFVMGFNLIGNLIFSKDLLEPNSKRGKEFYYHARKVMEMAGKPNVADFLPAFRWVDPQGIRRKTQLHVNKAFEIAGEFIKERLKEKESEEIKKEEGRKDYLDVLLEFRGDGVEEPSCFSSWIINVIVFEMFTAGTDTTTSTLEWAMAELLHNPAVLQKLQAELRSTIPPEGNLEETHLQDLPYLSAVVKETLRLHPPLPFLFPRMAMKTCRVLGYRIPAETQVLVNVWAIGRDPNNWKDASVFSPERFLEPSGGGGKDFKGQHFDFIPFGSGRRMCPAVPLAARVLPVALGSLILSFDWALPDGTSPEEMDMSEEMGITLRKKIPLKAIPTPHKRRRL